MEQNTIRINGDRIEALDDGGISINDLRVSNVEDLEKVVNVLIKSVIAIVQNR